MQINIINVFEISLTPAIQDYLEKKLAKIREKLIDPNDESAQCDVELGKTVNQHSGDIYQVKLILHIAGKNLVTDETASDIYAAIDQARDELERQLRTHQGKQETVFRKRAGQLKRWLKGLGSGSQ